jgi:hypothetical protein
METQNSNRNLETTSNNQNPYNRGRVMGGLVVIIVGVLFLAKTVGVDFPYWFFSFPMLLIAIGLYIAFRHSFRNFGWLIPTGIGAFLLAEEIVPEVEVKQYLWPFIIIAVGLFMIFRPRRHRDGDFHRRWERDWNKNNVTGPVSESFADKTFETVTFFGSDKKQIISKDFKGGETICFFGGTELNLTQSDVNGYATVEVVQCFGGTKIIVPPHWKVQTDELVCIFGALEDKRQVAGSVVDPSKVLILKGTCIFGGIDLRSF